MKHVVRVLLLFAILGAAAFAGASVASAQPGAEPPRLRAPSLQPAPEGARAGIILAEPPRRDTSHRWFYAAGGACLILAFYLTTRSRAADRARPEDDGDHGDDAGDDGDAPPARSQDRAADDKVLL